MDSGPTSSDSTDKSEKKERWETTLQEFDPKTISLEKYQKKMQKKARKENNRNIKRADELTTAFQSFSGLKEDDDDDEYDFEEYFDK